MTDIVKMSRELDIVRQFKLKTPWIEKIVYVYKQIFLYFLLHDYYYN